MAVVTVNQLALQGRKDLELKFPDGWDVEVSNMEGVWSTYSTNVRWAC